MKRCLWANKNEELKRYHDLEWGVKTFNDLNLFEKLTLEIMQSGLSWNIILNKRNYMMKVFDGFNFEKISMYNNDKLMQFLNDKNLIKNKLKLTAMVNNAKKFILIRNKFGSFSEYIWSFVNKKQIINNYNNQDEVPSKTTLSEYITKNLKQQGFKFIGPIIIYSFLQSAGLINDHINSCFKK
ncbi:DNA-3-methyladenine glycosylase I [Spiroplasma litorale]|nr:DNA-3-methyladenine glycosylase I [Spiroplasma litorale]